MGGQSQKKSLAGLSFQAKTPLRIPLAVSIAKAVIHSIREREWQDTLPGERALCERYQVSRPSLRLALAQLEKEGWIRSMPGKVRRICRQLPIARGPAGIAQRRIMFLSAYPLSQMEPSVVTGIAALRQWMAEAGYFLEVIAAPEFSRERVTKHLEDMVESHPSAGWILYRAPHELQSWFAGRKVPAMIMGTSYPDVPLAYADLDFRAVSRHAAGFLLGKGHHPDRICLLLSGEHLAGIAASKDGFCEAVRATGGKEPRIVTFTDREDLIRQVARMFGQSLPPTGLIVQRPVYALSVVGFLMARLNRMLPRDVSLIALDDDPSLRYAFPEVARYTKNIEQITRKIWKVLIQVIQGSLPETGRATLFMPDWVPGETVGPPPV